MEVSLTYYPLENCIALLCRLATNKILLTSYESYKEQNIYGQWLNIHFNRRELRNPPVESVYIEDDHNKVAATTSNTRPRRKDTNAPKSILKTGGEAIQSTSSSSSKSSSKKRSKKGVKIVLDKSEIPSKHEAEEVVTCSAQLRTRSFTESDMKRVYFEGNTTTESIGTTKRGGGAWTKDKSRGWDGYEILEYVVESENNRLMPVLRFPTVAIVCIVILWSFSLVSTEFAGCTVLVVALWTYLVMRYTVVKETLLVISTLGIQLSQTNVLGRMKHVKFVPIDNIKAVVINEIIRRQRVLSYLLILLDVTESTGKIVVPLLIATLPRLRTIERIYHDVQRILSISNYHSRNNHQT